MRLPESRISEADYLDNGHPAAALQLASPRRLVYFSSPFDRSRRGTVGRLDGSWPYVGLDRSPLCGIADETQAITGS